LVVLLVGTGFLDNVSAVGEYGYGYIVYRCVDVDNQDTDIYQFKTIPVNLNVGTTANYNIPVPGIDGYIIEHVTVDGTNKGQPESLSVTVTSANTVYNPVRAMMYYTKASANLTLIVYAGTIHKDGTTNRRWYRQDRN
jgi:hypothetical protein